MSDAPEPTTEEMRVALKAAQVEVACSDLTDDGLALGFARTRPQYRRVNEWHRWMVWDGKRWSQDLRLTIFSEIREFLRWRANEADTESTTRKVRSAQTVAAVERLCHSDRDYAVASELFDADPWLLNTPGGVVDLHTGALSTHDPDKYLTRMTAVAPGGECPRWLEFLNRVMADDAELVLFLQRMAGYCLTGSTREHALFFAYGTGANGKGTFLNTLSGLLADYAATAAMETFTEATGERHTTELATLRGARMVTAQETESGRRWAESRIKSLTGGDPITARFMRQDGFTFQPQLKLLFSGNHRPRLSTVDEAIRRRMYLLPFMVTIPEAERDLDLTDKLKVEWPGILTWCITGCLDYLSTGLAAPARVREATDSYLQAQDVFADWLSQYCEIGSQHWDPPTRLFKSWCRFAEAAGERPGRQRDFNDRMEGAGYRQGRDSARGRYWVGLRVKPDTIPSSEEWTL